MRAGAVFFEKKEEWQHNTEAREGEKGRDGGRGEAPYKVVCMCARTRSLVVSLFGLLPLPLVFFAYICFLFELYRHALTHTTTTRKVERKKEVGRTEDSEHIFFFKM